MTHNFSKKARRQIVSITARRLADEIFQAERQNKPLCETRWEEYRTCLNSEEQATAIESFDARTKELSNGQ